MRSFRDIKRNARRQLHAALRIPALYIETPGATPALVYLRVHNRFDTVGEIKSLGYAENQENAPRLIFMRDEVQPVRGAVVSIDRGEAYRVDNVLPPDDITVSAEVVRMTAMETVNLPIPRDPLEPAP